MSVIYIQERGAYLSKRGERMIVTKNRQDLLDIPVANIDSLVVLGDVQITMQLLQ